MNEVPPVREPVPARFNLARYCLAENARVQPEKPALTIVGDDHVLRWTHGELDDKVRRLAAGLQTLGLPPGSRVMIRMGNEANAALAYFAAIAAGHVALLASSQLTFEEADFLREDCAAAALLLPVSMCCAAPIWSGCSRANRRTTPTPARTIPPISFTPPARPAGPRACCTRIAPPGRGESCIRTGWA